MDISRLREIVEKGAYDVPAEDVAEALLGWINPKGPEPAPPASADPEPPPSSGSP